jgi:hypothetical protein
LLRALQRPEQGGRPARNGIGDVTVSKAAQDGGLSKRQRDTAVRVARLDSEEFESAVESDRPPSVEALAKRGTKTRPRPPLWDLNGRDPADFKLATHALGQMRETAVFVAKTDAAAVVRGLSGRERQQMRGCIATLLPWVRQLTTALRRNA